MLLMLLSMAAARIQTPHGRRSGIVRPAVVAAAMLLVLLLLLILLVPENPFPLANCRVCVCVVWEGQLLLLMMILQHIRPNRPRHHPANRPQRPPAHLVPQKRSARTTHQRRA